MSESKSPKTIKAPREFFKITKDMLNDLLITFPEYEESITKEENDILAGDVSNNHLFKYC